jgi:hypothetical protein
MKKYVRRGKRRGVLYVGLPCVVLVIILCGLSRLRPMHGVSHAESDADNRQSGLAVEGASMPTVQVSSFLGSMHDVDSLCVLAASFRASGSCTHPDAMIRYRLFVSAESHRDSRWPAAQARLKLSGWSEMTPLAQDGLSYAEVLRGQFLCDTPHALMFRDAAPTNCVNIQILFLHPNTFVPIGQHGLTSTNFCAALLVGGSNPDLAASQFEHGDEHVHAVVATCGGESLSLSEDPQFPIAVVVEELRRIRWIIATPLSGLGLETTRSMQIKCLSRTSARHRVELLLVPTMEAMPKFWTAAAQCEDAHQVLRSVGHFVPLITFSGMGALLSTLAAYGGKQYIDDSKQMSHCEIEKIWFVNAFEEMAKSGSAAAMEFMTGDPQQLRFFGDVLLDTKTVKNITTSNLTIVMSEPGSTCLSACASKGLGCAPAALDWWFPNSCEALASLMPHHDWFCHYEVNPILAAVAPCARFHDGYLVVRDDRVTSRNATCAASLPEIERVCTCIHAKAASTAQMQRLTSNDAARLVGAALWPPSRGPSLHGGAPDNTSCPCPSKPYGRNENFEAVCMEYLGDYRNVLVMTAMSNNIKFGRTAKFRVQYKNKCVEAILKPPQASFPLEPFAEYIAFEVDRTLDVKLIPPTTWMFVPMSAIEAASNAEIRFSQWINQEVFVYALQSRLTTLDPVSSALLIGCSVQLYVRGARWQRGTPLNYDDRSLDMLIPSTLRRGLPSHPAIVRYLSDAMVIDTIIANDDRSSQKNSNVFLAGLGEFEFVLLDQGKSLYHQEVRSRYLVRLSESPTMDMRATADGTPLCVFKKSTKEALMTLQGNAKMSERIKRFVPPFIWKAVGQKRLNWLDYRVERLRGHISHCVRLLGEDIVTL